MNPYNYRLLEPDHPNFGKKVAYEGALYLAEVDNKSFPMNR